MPGTGDVGIHIVLGEAHLATDLIGMDLTFSDQIIDRRFADMEDVSHLLGGKRFVLSHWSSSFGVGIQISNRHYTILWSNVQVRLYHFVRFRTMISHTCEFGRVF